MEPFAATVGLVAAHIVLTQTSPQAYSSLQYRQNPSAVFMKYMLCLSKVEKKCHCSLKRVLKCKKK